MKCDISQFANAETSMDGQDLCALPTTMEAFKIYVNRLASATQLLVHSSTIIS